MNIKLLTTMTVIILSLTGCATVTRGSTEALVIESEPSGAQVQLSNGMKGTIPTSFKVKRKHDLIVTVSKPGYETASINVTSQMAGAGGAAMAGNVLVGGIIGLAIDASSGATKELKPNPVKVTLNPY